jgi:ribonuclease HI
VLRTEDGSVKVDACDEESGASDERLALLAVVRGLEAVPEPACVTLVTAHGSIQRGLRFGLDNWRDSQWQWERFGKMTPIKNFDLWQRVDRALQFHEVDCRSLQRNLPTDDLTCPVPRSLVADCHCVTAGQPECTARSTAMRRGTSTHHAAGQILMGTLRRLFGWCGLCRSNPALVIAAH